MVGEVGVVFDGDRLFYDEFIVIVGDDDLLEGGEGVEGFLYCFGGDFDCWG